MSQAMPDTSWKPLDRVGGAAALVTAVLIPLQIVVFVAWPPPLEGTVSEWFTLFEDNWLLGLLSLDLLLIVDYCSLSADLTRPLRCPETSQRVLDGSSYGPLLRSDSGLLRIEHGLRDVPPQRPVRGRDNRCAENYGPASGADDTRYLRTHCVSGKLRPRVSCRDNNRSCHAA
jgi:hypothetical protein